MFRWTLRVYIEDTDAGGIVYHANYLNFCERARTEWLLAAGLQDFLHDEGHRFVVRRARLDYRLPCHLGECLTVESRLLWCRQASFALAQTIWRDAQVVCSAEVELACLSRSAEGRLQPVRLPPALRAVLTAAQEP